MCCTVLLWNVVMLDLFMPAVVIYYTHKLHRPVYIHLCSLSQRLINSFWCCMILLQDDIQLLLKKKHLVGNNLACD